MRRVLGLVFSFALLSSLNAQNAQPIPVDTARQYFSEAQTLCRADNAQLWGVSLCGPMMFVDGRSRFIVATHPDANGVLKQQGDVYVGYLPVEMNIGNTEVEWSGVHWTQLVWPMPDDKAARGTLMTHELFHRIQKQLGLPLSGEADNRHLDTLDGRYYLQLEWRALARALKAESEPQRREAAIDALVFRAARYKLLPDAATNEHALEINEGLAEYTGVKVGNQAPAEQARAAVNDLQNRVPDPTFVRSFAYASGPAYGLLLDRYLPGWRQQIRTPGSSFESLLRTALKAELPANATDLAQQRAANYDGAILRAAETERDAKRNETIAKYKKRFVDGPVLVLPLVHMGVQFDPRTLQPLENFGTVYPSIRVTDDWGVLECSNGALLKSGWRAVIVTAPEPPATGTIKGDGWMLNLKPGWKITPGARKGDFVVSPES